MKNQIGSQLIENEIVTAAKEYTHLNSVAAIIEAADEVKIRYDISTSDIDRAICSICADVLLAA